MEKDGNDLTDPAWPPLHRRAELIDIYICSPGGSGLLALPSGPGGYGLFARRIRHSSPGGSYLFARRLRL
jgi:hypothetical protein